MAVDSTCQAEHGIDRPLRPGDQVEVRSLPEILATLDGADTLDEMPFMPEMLRHAGRRYTVSRRVDKICDTVAETGSRRLHATVYLDDLRCDGSAHGGCQAGCRLYFKEAWLRRVDGVSPAPAEAALARARGGDRGGDANRARRRDRGGLALPGDRGGEGVGAPAHVQGPGPVLARVPQRQLRPPAVHRPAGARAGDGDRAPRAPAQAAAASRARAEGAGAASRSTCSRASSFRSGPRPRSRRRSTTRASIAASPSTARCFATAAARCGSRTGSAC